MSDSNFITFGADNSVSKVANLIIFTTKWHMWKANASNTCMNKHITPNTTTNTIVKDITFRAQQVTKKTT
jgi:hypothetical protein